MHDERRDLSGSERSVDIAHRPDGDVDALGPVDEPVSWCGDRKSTRLNSSHSQISYAVFCLKKKNTAWHVRSAQLYDDFIQTPVFSVILSSVLAPPGGARPPSSAPLFAPAFLEPARACAVEC